MDLLCRMLKKSPVTRIGIDKIKVHPFFKDIDWEKLARREVEPPVKLEISEEGEDEILNAAKPEFTD